MSVETNVFVLEKPFLTCRVPSIQWKKKNTNAKSKIITTPKLKKVHIKQPETCSK